MKPASWPVDLPVRKGQLTREEQRHKDMQDTVKEFSFGALGICFLPYILITISTYIVFNKMWYNRPFWKVNFTGYIQPCFHVLFGPSSFGPL